MKQVRFLLAGGVQVIIYFTFLFLLGDILNMDPVATFTISYLISVTFQFFSNKYLVFKESSSERIQGQILQFVVVTCINYLITLVSVMILRHWTGESYSGSVIGGFLSTLFTYFAFNFFLFRKDEKKRELL